MPATAAHASVTLTCADIHGSSSSGGGSGTGHTYPVGSVSFVPGDTVVLSGTASPDPVATLTISDSGLLASGPSPGPIHYTFTAPEVTGLVVFNSANANEDVTATWSCVHVGQVATASRTANPNNAISAPVPAGGIASGTTVLASVATGTFNGPAACTDTKSNPYSVVAEKNTGSGRLFVCQSTLTSALTGADTVNASYPGFSGLSVISVVAITPGVTFAGLSSTAAGSNPPVNSGNINLPSAGLIFGAVANSNVSTFTPTSDWTAIGTATGGSGAGKRTVSTVFQYAIPGLHAVTGSLSGSGFWQAAEIG